MSGLSLLGLVRERQSALPDAASSERLSQAHGCPRLARLTTSTGFLEAIRGVQPASRWKTIVTDEPTSAAMLNVLKMYDILDENVQRAWARPLSCYQWRLPLLAIRWPASLDASG